MRSSQCPSHPTCSNPTEIQPTGRVGVHLPPRAQDRRCLHHPKDLTSALQHAHKSEMLYRLKISSAAAGVITYKPRSLRKWSRLSKVLRTFFIHQGINKALDVLEGKHVPAWGYEDNTRTRSNPVRTRQTSCKGRLETCPHRDTQILVSI